MQGRSGQAFSLLARRLGCKAAATQRISHFAVCSHSTVSLKQSRRFKRLSSFASKFATFSLLAINNCPDPYIFQATRAPPVFTAPGPSAQPSCSSIFPGLCATAPSESSSVAMNDQNDDYGFFASLAWPGFAYGQPSDDVFAPQLPTEDEFLANQGVPPFALCPWSSHSSASEPNLEPLRLFGRPAAGYDRLRPERPAASVLCVLLTHCGPETPTTWP